MPGWVTCPACNLKHTARPDGICPRCKANLAAAATTGTASAEAPPTAPPAPPAVAHAPAAAAAPAIAAAPARPAPAVGAPHPTPPAVPPQPAPAHPAPVHPAPAAPALPSPTHPAPVHPLPVHPAPTHPAPAHPAPEAPTPAAKAAPAHAVPARPAPVAAANPLVYKHEPPLFAIVLVLSILVWLALVVGTFGIALLYAPVVFLIYLFAQSALIAYLKGTAIKITPRQFPDLHARLIACCEKLGIARVPDCYLLNGQGGFNAFATRFLGRNFVVLFSDVVDALEDRPGAVDFYIGHELAHIQRGHLAWAPVLMPGNLLPLLGAAYHRACESTCDRYGAACCKETQDVTAGITALAAGEKRWKTLSVEEYLAQAQESRGFWMSFHELVSDYPWLVKRVARVVAFREGRAFVPPARNPLAYLFAVFVPRMTGAGGGGIVNLLLVVALVGIIAAIAIPSLLRARVAANESAAISEITTIVGAETEYARQHERFASIACLAALPGCDGVPANPPLLPAELASDLPRHGYRYALKLGAGNATQFAYTAVPVTAGQTGRRSFCADSSGKLAFSTGEETLTGEGASCNPTLAPLGGS